MNAGGSNTPSPHVTPLKTPSILFDGDRPIADVQTIMPVTPSLDLQDTARGDGDNSFTSVTKASESDTADAKQG